ncbi:hypothetical protein NQ314_012980 [Rhamnusium bicolor]|uniref:G-protein coupled receptors family 2 profile 2 domain-containing protein n=1 Tax=Rhamnusium bicolor TaxID=1586634 RepID=A0AAV8X9K1_9CUCU|nr:hypothetical protein NQ314_012980 [Rhamnusium bicolor]
MDGDVLWPQTEASTCVKSNPFCIDKNMEIVTRCCDANRNWENSPHCDYFQNTIKSPCPDDFITNFVKKTCIFVIKESTYPPVCPYEEKLPFFEYIHDIDPTLLPVWMPVVRNTGKYGLGLLRWMEPTLDYKTTYTECIEDNCNNYHFSGFLKDKGCLIFYNSSYVVAASCKERHTAICAYNSLPNHLKSFCSQNFPLPDVCMQSDYSTKSKCFCKGSMDNKSSAIKAEFLQPYQNLIYPALSKEMCYIGLQRNSDDTYIWLNSSAKINYTYWAGNITFGKYYKYGAISPDGWILLQTETESECVLYQVDLPNEQSEINLEYEEQLGRFTVKITNPRRWVSYDNGSAPMVFCFTDAASDTILSKMEVTITAISINYTTYSFYPHDDGPGTYWCEAFLYPEVVAKSSNEYLLRYTNLFAEEYAVTLKTSYAEISNPLTSTNIKLFRKRLSDQIQLLPNISNFITRIYKIVDINEEKLEITINFHLVNPADSEPLKLYSSLRGYMEQNLTQFTFVNVLGVDSCVGIQTVDASHTTTWPVTNINEVAIKPREGYCLRSDGSIMIRQCSGDYIDGAQWSELEETCNIQQSTNITVNLTNIVFLNNPKLYTQQIAEIAEDYANLLPMDIHLISKFLEQVASSDDINIYMVVKIIDQLMNVPENVLKESQILFNATDRILYYVDKIIVNSKYIGELTEANFFIISYYIKDSNLSGIVIKSYNEIYFTIFKIFNVFDMEEVKKIDNLNAAIVLSESLMTHIYLKQDYDSRIIVTVYKNPKFFNEELKNIKNAGIIMGVLLPDLGDEFSGEIFTIYNNSNIGSDFNCSFWSYDLDIKKGSWKNEAQRGDGQSSVFCIYDHLTHLALVRKEEFNITQELEKIISSEKSLSEKLEEAATLTSNYYSDFQPVDVMLLSTLLYEVTRTDEDNLDLVADIVNKVIDIPSEILQKSQIMYNATGKILTYFNDILQKFSSSTVIERDNFYAVVHHLKEGNIHGFIMNNCASKCNFTLLRVEPNEADISLIENLDTALIISQALLDQLINVINENYVPKIVITFFLDDTLFIEDYSNTKITTNVVGILLPNFDERFNGGLKLVYSINLNMTSNYTCSVYYNDSNDTTYEKGFWNSENPPIPTKNFLECLFWKARYFALVYNLFNLTSILEGMLISEQPMENILTETNVIASTFYTYLQAVDIFLIARLLSRVAEVNNLVLEACLSIVSGIMKTSRHTLINSQQVYNATNMILFYFNKVAQNYDKTKAIYKDNVILIVSLLSETGMFGIALDNCNKECEITVLYEEKSYSNSTSTIINFDTELKINKHLIDELLHHKGENYIPKLVLMVYYNDALFNEDTVSKKTGKIFGVHLPDFSRILSHEIKLYFNISADDVLKGYDCAAWNYQEDEHVRGYWAYQSQARSIERFSCNFYQQSYFTLIEGNGGYDNITSALTTLSKADISFPEKLYKTEDVSYYYSNLKPVDVYIISKILSQCDQLADDGLDRLSTIINNILRVPSPILIESQDQYNTLNQILYNIIDIASFQKSFQYSSINDQFTLVVCDVNSTAFNGVVATINALSCTSNIEERHLTDTENAIAVIILSQDLLNQVIANEDYPKIVFTLFLNDIFFTNNETSNTSVILGVSIPHLTETLEGDIIVLFNSSTESNYDCAYWDNENTNIWNAVDGTTQTGLFTRCNFRKASYLTLVENINNNITADLTEMLKEILEGDLTTSEKLSQTLTTIITYRNYFEAMHVYLVAKILSRIDQVSFVDLELTANITNFIMEIPREVLTESQVKYNATDWILHLVDTIADSFNNLIDIETENFAIIISNNITGITIENCDASCDVKILCEDVNITSLKNNNNLNVALILDEKLRKQLDNNNSPLNIIVTIYFTNALFNEDNNITHKNIGQIIGVVFPSTNQEMEGPLQFYYYTNNKSSEICAFWNYTVNEGEVIKGHWERDQIPFQQSHISLCESTHTTHFALLENDKNVTNDLENILNSHTTSKEKLKKVLAITLDSPKKLLPVDIYLISKILNFAIEGVGSDELFLTSHIVSGLFHVPRETLRESQLAYYATDKILHSIDEMTRLLDHLDDDPVIYENLVVTIYDLKRTNTSGLVLDHCGNSKCDISILENNVNLTELGENKNLETAVALSDELLEQVRQSTGAAKLVITVFFSDVLFNEQSQDKKTTMICGVSDDEAVIKGSWKTDADPRSKEQFTVCEFDHITHFALLLANDNNSYIDANKFHILDIITAVNCLLSVVGIFGILLTAALFERWRRNTGNQILLNFSIAISIKMVMLYVSVEVYASHAEGVMCSVTGAILHFAMLSEFCWMLIIAILQFKRFVEVLGGPPKYVLLKACVCGWVFPLLPVMLILIIDTDNYNEGEVGLCYPSGLGLYLGIWLPLIIIVTINFVIFIFIIYNVFHKKTETRDLVNHEILFQWRLALLLFSMLGLTWLFGFLSQIQGAYVFVYLFCFTATLQGFIMFLFFIVFNQSTRFLYSQSIKLWLYSRGYKVQ